MPPATHYPSCMSINAMILSYYPLVWKTLTIIIHLTSQRLMRVQCQRIANWFQLWLPNVGIMVASGALQSI